MNAPNPDRFFSGPQRDLGRAIAAGDPAAVAALAPNTDLDAPGAHDMTLLMLAMAWAQGDPTPERHEVITALVAAGADPGHVVPELGSALDLAIASPSTEPLQAMLDGGLSPDAMGAGGDIPALHQAANEDSVEHMRLLLDRGADVNGRDTLGTPAITDALRGFQLDQVSELLDRGADPRAVNLLGQSFPNELEAMMARQPPGSPALEKMTEIRDRIVADGVAWPPPPPAEERDRMRERGEEPIVPAGASS